MMLSLSGLLRCLATREAFIIRDSIYYTRYTYGESNLYKNAAVFQNTTSVICLNFFSFTLFLMMTQVSKVALVLVKR